MAVALAVARAVAVAVAVSLSCNGKTEQEQQWVMITKSITCNNWMRNESKFFPHLSSILSS